MGFDLKASFTSNLAESGKSSQARLMNAKSLDEAIIDTNPFKDDSVRNSLIVSNSTYSGTDCTVIAQVNEKLIALGNLATFSYSIYREKAPVRVLGRSHAKGYTAGGRTISGSMVFVVFDQNPLYDIIKELSFIKNPSERYTSPVPDQLPPLDLIIVFNNEYGHTSVLKLYGVEFMQEGQVHSINDLYTENTMQYLARDIDLMINYEQVEGFRNMLFERMSRGLYVDSHLGTMLEYKRKLGSQISGVNDTILKIDQERGRRAVAGVFTLGASAGLNAAIGTLPGVDTVSRSDLNRVKSMELNKKQLLLEELNRVNEQISLYEQNIKGWNAQNSKEGIAGSDNLSHTNIN